MRIKGGVKKKKFNSSLFRDLKNLEQTISAGYPASQDKSNEKDANGHTPLYKAYKINFASDNFVPFLQIAFETNKQKYSKKFLSALRFKDPKTIDKSVESIGEEMVEDIKTELSKTQKSPISTNRGCLFGAVTYVKVKK